MKNTLKLCLILIISLNGNIQAQERMPALDDQLTVWLQKIPPGSETDFGFSSRNEFRMATLGSPIAVYRLNETLEGQIKPGDTKAIIPAGDWRVPVLVGEETRLLLTVVQTHKGWEIVDMGARDLAREIAVVCRKAGLNESRTLHLLRIYSLTCDLIFTGEAAGSDELLAFYPLESAMTSLPELRLLRGRPAGFADLLPIIKQNQSLRTIKASER